MATKLKENTCGTHIFMRLRLENNHIYEIDAYITESGFSYITSADNNPEARAQIIKAFHELY